MAAPDTLRKAAKRWLKALRDGDAAAHARFRRAYPNASDRITLRDVQYALARERGHENWVALRNAVDSSSPAEPPLTSLLAAAARGDAAAVSALLDVQPELIDQRGLLPGHTGRRTALHFGIAHEAVVRALLARGADPNIRDDGDRAYPLHFAAERGDLAVVKVLVEHGADPIGADTTHGLDVLGWAVCFDYAQRTDVAQYLLAHGARHTLFSAAALGDADAIRETARAGADLNERMDRTNYRRTALHLAVAKGQPAAVRALTEAGADLNVVDAIGLTAVDQAALTGDTGTAQVLLDAGAVLTLPAAIALGHHEEVERLLRANSEILDPTNNRSWARLIVHASTRAPRRVMEALLRVAARHRAGLTIVNMEDDIETAVDQAPGFTALHAAAFNGNDEAVGVLLEHGVNPRARDGRYCGTPAGWARYAGHLATANLILEAEVDLFDAIDFDRADRIEQILDHDPAAIDRPFRAYASCGVKEGQWWPVPDCTPLQWATARQKANAARALIERGAASRTREDIERADLIVSFLQSACWDHDVHGRRQHRMHDRAAQRLLADDPQIARDSIYTAVVCGNVAEVERLVAERPGTAGKRGGPRGWTPILYLAYARFSHQPTIDYAIRIARLLLDHGADPNDFYMAGDARYSVLVGVAGEGEQDSPRQPCAAALFELLLERGADPFDIQVLYNTHFSGDVLWWLELVHAHTIRSPRTEAWSDPEWRMFDMGTYGSGARFLLELAVKKHDVRLAEWLLARGANPNAAPARDPRFPKQSLYELAVLENVPGIADLLARFGATRSAPVLDDAERFREACFRLDRDGVRSMLRLHPEYVRSPEVLFDAARRNRPDVLEILIDAGVSADAQDRTGKRALHEAAAHNAVEAARLLAERGAEIDPRELTYRATPIGWAAHGDHAGVLAFLRDRSRDIWVLCFAGCVERVREVLAENPGLARVVEPDGTTPLWWLPDDESRAMQIVELLLAAGANAGAKNSLGRTAADWARRRGMTELAEALNVAEAAQNRDQGTHGPDGA